MSEQLCVGLTPVWAIVLFCALLIAAGVAIGRAYTLLVHPRPLTINLTVHQDGRLDADAVDGEAAEQEATAAPLPAARVAMLMRSAERYARRNRDRMSYADRDAASFAEAGALYEAMQSSAGASS